MDDLHANFFDPRKHVNALLWLALYLMVETPFAWKKFKGGLRVAFTGYELDYSTFQVGMSDARGTWLCLGSKKPSAHDLLLPHASFLSFLAGLGSYPDYCIG